MLLYYGFLLYKNIDLNYFCFKKRISFSIVIQIFESYFMSFFEKPRFVKMIFDLKIYFLLIEFFFNQITFFLLIILKAILTDELRSKLYQV